MIIIAVGATRFRSSNGSGGHRGLAVARGFGFRLGRRWRTRGNWGLSIRRRRSRRLSCPSDSILSFWSRWNLIRAFRLMVRKLVYVKPNFIAVFEHAALHPFAVDEGAIRTAEIFDEDAARC